MYVVGIHGYIRCRHTSCPFDTHAHTFDTHAHTTSRGHTNRYPVTTGDTGRVRYELVATFACEGTVGSVAVGNVDTVQSFDDGSALFLFLSPWVSGFLLIHA